MSSDPDAGGGPTGGELVEVVAADGTVVDVVTRGEMRARNLRHRCTYVSIVTSDDRLIVHQRADWKDVFPSYWDVCFGGIAGVGEAWEIAARRELAEEAGVDDVALTELGSVAYDEDDGRLVGRVYVARFDGALSCPDGEVVAVDSVPLADLDRWLAGRSVCPDSAQLALPLVRAHLESQPS
ncbi:MAG: NUDIX domain-containing protein [Acidimicrobiia bacterium]|nr:NUDIX domain-containing protein [Acidimicrobiia bacterium]